MQIPKGILKIGSVAASQSARYAFNGVQVKREKDGVLRAAATDGRRLVLVRWKESVTSELPGYESECKPKDDFTAVIPSRVARLADSAVPRKNKRRNPIASPAVLVDEQSSNGRIRFVAPNPEYVQRFDVEAIEGDFPPVDAVIPKHKIISDSDESGKFSGNAFRTAVDARLLIGVLEAMLNADPNTGESAVILEVPCRANRPIKLTRGSLDGRGVEVTGIIMPVNIK